MWGNKKQVKQLFLMKNIDKILVGKYPIELKAYLDLWTAFSGPEKETF